MQVSARLWVFVALSTALAPVHAQESRASLIGRASDPTGALIANAKVTATNTATNAVVTSITNDSGSYEIPYLISGVYTITLEAAGFKKAVRNGIQLRIGDRITLDFSLILGDVAESVQVTGETPNSTPPPHPWAASWISAVSRNSPWLVATRSI